MSTNKFFIVLGMFMIMCLGLWSNIAPSTSGFNTSAPNEGSCRTCHSATRGGSLRNFNQTGLLQWNPNQTQIWVLQMVAYKFNPSTSTLSGFLQAQIGGFQVTIVDDLGQPFPVLLSSTHPTGGGATNTFVAGNGKTYTETIVADTVFYGISTQFGDTVGVVTLGLSITPQNTTYTGFMRIRYCGVLADMDSTQNGDQTFCGEIALPRGNVLAFTDSGHVVPTPITQSKETIISKTWYTLEGRLVTTSNADNIQLPAGIYIMVEDYKSGFQKIYKIVVR